MARRTSLITALIAGPNTTTAVPLGRAQVYCARANPSGGSATATLRVPLAGRATINIQISWVFDNISYTSSWKIDGDTVTSPRGGTQGKFRAVTAGTTLNAGAHTIIATAATVTSGTLYVVAIVGTDTEADDVSF